MHTAIVEAAAENDDTLMEHFLKPAIWMNQNWQMDFAKGSLIKVYFLFLLFCYKNMGSGRIMGFINDVCPSPADRPNAKLKNGELKVDASGPTTLFIYKTMSEPKVGRVSYFKVYSGKVKTGDELNNNANRGYERLNQIYVSNGKNREAVNELVAGDLGVVVKLKDSHTNNTLSIKGHDAEVEPIPFQNQERGQLFQQKIKTTLKN